MHSDLFVCNSEVSIKQLSVSVTDKKKREVKAPTSVGIGSNHEATPNDIYPSHRGSFKAHITKAQEESKLSNSKAGNSPRSLYIEAEGNKNRTT